MTKALTKGAPRLIVGFGIPVLLGYLFQQFYSIVDTAIVGKTLGGMALAAVGSTGSFNFLVVGFSVGICGGFAIPVAQQFGAGNYQEMRRYITNAVWLCAAVGLAVTAATTLLCGTILTWMNTPADIYSQAYIYIITIFAGLPAYFLYNFAAGVLRSLGDSKTPVIWLIAASLVNIVLDIIFIMIFHLNVFGAALATVLAQLLAGTGCLIRMMTAYPILHMEQEDWHLALVFVKWMTEKSGYSFNEGGLPLAVGDENYPEVYDEFIANNVEFIANEPAAEGEEDLLNELNADSELMIAANGNDKIQEIIEHASNKDKSFDDIMKEWNQKWSDAQEMDGVEVK